MVGSDTYANCRCPHCKHPLDQVSIEATACPQCQHELDPPAVWLTRRYPGQINLPWWVAVLGWPLLLMLAGAGVFMQRYYVLGHLPRRGDWGALAGEILFASGFVRFIVKYAIKGDE
jgi:hypothetical protein